MAQLQDIVSAQRSLEECFSRRMAELEAQLHVGGPAKDTVAKVADEFRTFRELVFKMLGLLRQQINECHRSVDILETRHRRKSLLFLGVPETDKEDCTATVLSVLQNKVCLREISAEEIYSCYRIGTPTKERSRPILVRFKTANTRTIVWQQKTSLKGSSLSVREFLTKARQIVFGRARQHFGMRACWTQDGSIFIKAPDGSRHKVTSVDELSPLLERYPRAPNSSSSSTKPGRGNVESSGAKAYKNIAHT